MKITELLNRITEKGGRLIPEGDALTIEAPAPLPDDMIEVIRQHKAKILALLQTDTKTRERPGKAGRWGRPCPICGDEWQWPTTSESWVCSCCYAGGVITEGQPA